MIKKCLECKKEFNADRKSRKFCSQLCYRKYNRKQMQSFYDELKEEGLKLGK